MTEKRHRTLYIISTHSQPTLYHNLHLSLLHSGKMEVFSLQKKIGGSLALLVLALSLVTVITVTRQQALASTPAYRVAIIGGGIYSQRTSHITIATVPEVRVGMRIFYWCSVPSTMIRTVYPNHTTNVLGRSTWQWTQGAPCNTGRAVIIVVAGATTIQRTFAITPKIGINGNPWGYDFTSGRVITAPPLAFCRYFSCIANFSQGRGYVVECRDLRYSRSGGIRGACSSHRGVYRPLYDHAGTSPTPISPTRTPIPPTATPLPTPTAIIGPTATLVPPTPTLIPMPTPTP